MNKIVLSTLLLSSLLGFSQEKADSTKVLKEVTVEGTREKK